MDKPRANPPKKRGKLYLALAIVGAIGVTLGLSRLQPAPPGVDREIAWTDTVVRGPMVRQVRGAGTLVPEEIRIIPAITAGRIEQILVDPGTPVEAGTMLIRLTNPDVQLQLLESQRALSNARSALINLEASLETQRLTQEGVVAQLRSQYNDALREDSVNEVLNRQNLITRNEYLTARDRLRELEARYDFERKSLAVLEGSIEARIDAQKDEVNRLQQIVQFRTEEVESMNVIAPESGVLQRLGGTAGRLEIGEYVLPGTELARVVQPGKLKAELRIPETQMVDVTIGQEAEIDTRNGIVMGHVVRIDPAAQNGTVGVDVALPDELPAGARPDLSVDGRVIVDRLEDVLYMGRPQYGNANQTIGIFKLESDGRTAIRVTVQLGAASVNEVEIKSGLNEGDIVILTDLSQWDSYDRIRLR
ncbi:MAG: HlyD family efflux transporter periplasmic adaptor subunit [Gemmatimonadetes bacterium]|nr:HlyD family efflux transporter periplasmic adaptor subunit [Gemmatimonadota bacterium]